LVQAVLAEGSCSLGRKPYSSLHASPAMLRAILAGCGAVVAAQCSATSCRDGNDESSLLQTKSAVSHNAGATRHMLAMDMQLNQQRQPSLVERIAAAPSATERLELLKPLAWAHIPKAGDSFANVLLGFSELWGACSAPDALLESNGRQECDIIFSEATKQCPGTMTSPFPDPSVGLFCGHPMLGATYAQTQGHLVAMFRQPEQRILSSYYDVKEDGLVAGGWVSPVPPSSASDYAVAAQGCVTKMLTRAETAGGLTGVDPCAPPAVSAEEAVLARDRVLQDFAFVGILEEWDLSICLFHVKFGGSCLESDFANLHAGPNASKASSYDTSVLEGFVDESDGAVYNAAKFVFRSDLTRYGLSSAACAQLCPSPSAAQQAGQTALMQLKVQDDKARQEKPRS